MPVRLLAFILALAVVPSALAQQVQETNQTAILAGYGSISDDVRQTAAWHINVRRRFFSPDSIPGLGPLDLLARSGGLSLSAELFFQYGNGGTALAACLDPQPAFCLREVAPSWFLSTGIVSRWDVGPKDWPVRLYFLPLTMGLYLRGYDAPESPGAAVAEYGRSEVRFGVGAGNGVGLRMPIGETDILLEVRFLFVLDSRREVGGGIPVSIGVTF